MSEETARDLENAATLLRERGWCGGRGDVRTRDGRLNVIAAVDDVTRSRPASDGVLDRFRDHIGNQWITAWEMAPGRTAEEVISALEAAASDLRSRASS